MLMFILGGVAALLAAFLLVRAGVAVVRLLEERDHD